MDKSIAYKQYINDISKVLDIQPPEMRTVPAAELLTPTQIAAYADGSILCRYECLSRNSSAITEFAEIGVPCNQ